MRKLPNCPIKKKKSQIDHSLGNLHHIKKYGFGLLSIHITSSVPYRQTLITEVT